MKKTDDIDPLDRTFSLATLKGKGVRGKYYARVMKGSNLVRLKPEVARLFPTEQAVNDALATLVELTNKLPLLAPRTTRARTKVRAG